MTKRKILFHYEANNVANPRVLMTTALNFGADEVILINTSGQQLQNHGSVKVYPEMHLALEDYKDYKKVFLKPPESIPGNPKYKGFLDKEYEFTWLKDYIHPEGDVLYVIGPDQYTLPIDMLETEGNDLVAMEITRNSLWSIVAGGIVMRDAYLQDQYGKKVE